jgi:hypothetical protein
MQQELITLMIQVQVHPRTTTFFHRYPYLMKESKRGQRISQTYKAISIEKDILRF